MIPAGSFKQSGNGYYARIETRRTGIANTGYDFSKIDGIMIPVSQDLFYATTWKQIVIQPPSVSVSTETETERTQEQSSEDSMEQSSTEEIVSIQQPEVSEQEVFAMPQPEKSEQETSAAQNCPEAEGVETPECVGNRILELFPKMYPFEIENIKDCVRLDLKDMGYLPVRYWSLAGNPFLLQGYYCYRHLIFLKDTSDKCAVGVPGIYSNQNKEKASKCGFLQFQTLARVQENRGAFGYWLYYIL
jgi:hypothetical protein